MKYFTYSFLFLSLLSCDNELTFNWNPEVKTIVNGDIANWLKKAPFTGIWDPNNNKEGNVYFTNTKEVFPFIGEFKNEDDNLILVNKKAKPFYKEQITVFKDNIWGESVVYTGLLYKTEEVFISPSYSKGANIITGGIQNLNQRNYASLAETQIISNTPTHKTGVYWVTVNNKYYLMGFYQKDQLIFQVAFPCTLQQKEKGLEQLAKVSKKMGINVSEWENASIEKLTITQKPISYWKDPFKKVFPTGFSHSLKIKLKGTPFEDEVSFHTKEGSIEYRVTDKFKNKYVLTINQEKTEMTSLAFSESPDAVTFDNTANYNRAFHITTKEVNGVTTQTAKTYFKDNKLFVFNYSYPTLNVENEKVLESILGTIKVKVY